MVETVKQLKLKVEEQEKRIKALEDKVGVWKLVLNFNFKNKVFKFLKSKILPVMQWSSLVVQFVNMRTVFFHGKEFLLKIVIDIENGGDIDLKPSYTFYYKTGKVFSPLQLFIVMSPKNSALTFNFHRVCWISCESVQENVCSLWIRYPKIYHL